MLRVHEKIRANIDSIPVGIPEPLIVGRGIDDVAIVVLTLSPKPEAAARWTAKDLYERRARVAHRAGQARRCRPDLYRRRAAGADPRRAGPREAVAVRRYAAAARGQGARAPTAPSRPDRCAMAARQLALVAGQTLRGLPISATLLLTTRDGRPVYVRDVASSARDRAGREPRFDALRNAGGRLAARAGRVPRIRQARRAPTPSSSPRRIVAPPRALQGQRLSRPTCDVEVTRDYGETANEKANELLFHLGLATVSIVVLVAAAIGWREAGRGAW